MPRTTVNVKKAIIDAFQGKDTLNWATLLELSKISKGGLSRHLNELIHLGVIDVEIEKDHRGRPKSVYRLNSKKLHDIYETSLYKEITSGKV